MTIRTACTAAALLALGGANVQAAVFNVSTAADFQTALTTAASNGEADTINLAAGTYNTSDNGPATFVYAPPTTELFSLTINGAGAGSTVLDGNDARQVLQIDLMPFRGDSMAATSVASVDESGVIITIQNLTIRDGLNAAPACVFDPDADGATTPDGDGCMGGGAAIETNNGSVVVQNCEFLNNDGIDGGGLQVRSFGGNITVDNCLFSQNLALHDEGVFSDGGGHGNGGGAYLYTNSGDVTVTNNAFSSNTARDVTGSSAFNAGGSGGGLVARSGNLVGGSGKVTIANNTFTSNTAADQVNNTTGPGGGGAAVGGGAVIIAHKSSPGADVTDNTFDGNNASEDGGGAKVIVKSGTANINDNVFEDNMSGVDDQIVGGTQARGDGGGLSIKADEGLNMNRNTFDGNATEGGDGGGAHVRGNMGWADNRFTNNDAVAEGSASGDLPGDGGGAHAYAAGTSDLTRNLFKDNTAEGSGGGLKLRSPFADTDVTASFFINNTSEGNATPEDTHASAGGGAGGWFFSDADTLNVVNNTFCFNDATGGSSGGGAVLYVETDGLAIGNLYNNNVWANTAAGDGNDLFVEDVDPDFADTVGTEVNLFSNNFAGFFDVCVDDAGCTDDLSTGGNVSVDPQFISAEECRVPLDSPVADLGDLNAPGLPELDFDGNPITRTLGAAAGTFLGEIPALSVSGLMILALLLIGIARYRLK